MKVKNIGIYGFTTEDNPKVWNNYDKGYIGYKLIKGKDEGKELEITKNEKGKINAIFFENEEPVKTSETSSLLVKVIMASDPNIFEDECNIFGSKHNVRFTQTHFAEGRFIGILFYED